MTVVPNFTWHILNVTWDPWGPPLDYGHCIYIVVVLFILYSVVVFLLPPFRYTQWYFDGITKLRRPLSSRSFGLRPWTDKHRWRIYTVSSAFSCGPCHPTRPSQKVRTAYESCDDLARKWHMRKEAFPPECVVFPWKQTSALASQKPRHRCPLRCIAWPAKSSPKCALGSLIVRIKLIILEQLPGPNFECFSLLDWNLVSSVGKRGALLLRTLFALNWFPLQCFAIAGFLVTGWMAMSIKVSHKGPWKRMRRRRWGRRVEQRSTHAWKLMAEEDL